MLLSWLRAAPVALLCIAGCSFDQSGLAGAGSDASVGDGPIDDGADAFATADADITPDGIPSRPDANVPRPADAGTPDANCPGSVLSVVPSNFGACDILSPLNDASLSNGTYVIDTTSKTLRKEGDANVLGLNAVVLPQTGGPDLLVWSVNSLVVDATAVVVVRGDRPLAIVSFNSITIDGGLLANATFEQAGPGGGGPSGGSVPSFCNSGTGAPGIVQTHMGSSSGSGAGGGGFGLAGGGGARVVDAGGSTIRADGGSTNGNAQLVPLRGGCGGGTGGNGGGAGGAGGGAIQLVANDALNIGVTGRIVARGGGGRGSADAVTGGAGGGAGGAILLEASTINVDGDLAANGGGGAEGTSGGGVTYFGEDGGNGKNGDTPAWGGSSGSWGGDGGNGGYLSATAEDGNEGAENVDPMAGGGGGGGAVGRIRINTSSFNANFTSTITPAETRG